MTTMTLCKIYLFFRVTAVLDGGETSSHLVSGASQSGELVASLSKKRF